MQVLKPIVHETIWGGAKLTPFSDSNSRSIGHLYSFIDTHDMCSQIVFGEYAGKSIHDWFLEHRARYGLSRYDELPILAALVEARENLSIQVHPDDAAAKKLEGFSFGKNESFYTLEAPTRGTMYNGCSATNRNDVAEKIKAGRALDVVRAMPCKAGDYVYIEAGTLHAATAGSLHFEIEENCGLTYRIYDFERLDKSGAKRPLQVEKALECLDVRKRSSVRRYGDKPIEERMYTTQRVCHRESFKNERDMFCFAVMVHGKSEQAGMPILPGTSILLEPGDALEVSGSEYIVAWPKRPADHVTSTA